MNIKPWREIAVPHPDVLEGTFQQSEFAADITAVRTGKATREYQEAPAFFQRTFITEGMRHLLISVAKRLNSQGGDPVIQLQTAFGGVKPIRCWRYTIWQPDPVLSKSLLAFRH